jgi:hypothetical protein
VPVYSFRCPDAHCEDVFLQIQHRNFRRRCKVCNKVTMRMFSSFGIHGENHAHQLYQFEQKYWEDATGQKLDNTGQLEKWCKDNGKAVVDPSTFRVTKPEVVNEREAIKALDKIYQKNHDLGAHTTKETG